VLAGQGYAVRQGRFKLVKAAALGRVQLFDVERDAGERHDLSGQAPAIVTHLQRLYEGWNAGLAAPLWSDAHAENVQKEYRGVADARRQALPPASKRSKR